MLVAWSDGDLTEILVKEIVGRLLASTGERSQVAAWARAAQDSSEIEGKDWMAEARDGLLEQCRLVGRA